MASTVYFADLRTKVRRNLLDKVGELLGKVELPKRVKDKGAVAIKLHFGEQGNTAYVRPVFLRRIVDRVRGLGGRPFLTDTNTLYGGTRSNAVSHLITAEENGFAFSVVGAPIIIADGLMGNALVRVPIEGKIYHEVSIAHAIYYADSLIVVTHFKGHEISGFGGAIKNIGMGCASREGKLSQHSTLGPKVKRKDCVGCKTCVEWCSYGAIEMRDEAAFINPDKCVECGECIAICPQGVIQIQWNEASPAFQRKMVEYALGALKNKGERAAYVSFVTQVSPYCDCYGYSDAPIVGDVGILASDDPVAIDQASIDLVNAQPGSAVSPYTKDLPPGTDKFRAVHREVDWGIQLAYGEEMGLGKRGYELVSI
ncbi:MAG: 4Fe-4S ferredoxin [Deltaproteobacteria bacterium RBG_13_52_11]|nr:MAG: 4Fe-4S ferredoxin [Deltaproteobacteria bacterium RBG_13_52_11]